MLIAASSITDGCGTALLGFGRFKTKRETHHQKYEDGSPCLFSEKSYAEAALAPFKKASKSALIVAASVVGMPCGKPL